MSRPAILEKFFLFCMVYLEQVVVQYVSRTYFDQVE